MSARTSSAASSDPVAAKSAFLCAYMSNHSDTLVAYILHELQSRSKRSKSSSGAPSALRARDVLEPKMASIDSRKMELSYRDAQDNRKPKTVEVEFDPPLAGYEEVRPRLLQMKMQAEASIGMSKRPTISKYRIPTWRNTLIVLCLLAVWIGCATQEEERGTFSRLRSLAGGWWTIRATGMFMVAVHAAEAAYQFRWCQKYSVPLPQTLLWAVTTFFLGFASLLEFRKVVREARIASVDKAK